MAFNLNNYETVEVRLEKFIKDFPDFRIDTELESFANDRFIVKAYLYRTFADGVAFSTGYAEEKITDRGVNATSALENCETSAIGRALANAGYAAKGKRPSREEMVKVARVENDKIVENVSPPAQFINTWDQFVEPKEIKPEVTLAEAASLVMQDMDGLPVLTCKHGKRRVKEGLTKGTGKPWKGAMCHLESAATKSQQCQPIWYLIDHATGKWRLPEGVE
jgi:hypothetical protein